MLVVLLCTRVCCASSAAIRVREWVVARCTHSRGDVRPIPSGVCTRTPDKPVQHHHPRASLEVLHSVACHDTMWCTQVGRAGIGGVIDHEPLSSAAAAASDSAAGGAGVVHAVPWQC